MFYDEYDKHVSEVFEQVLKSNAHLLQKQKVEKKPVALVINEKISEMLAKIIKISASPLIGNQAKIKLQKDFGNLPDMITMYMHPAVVEALAIEECRKIRQEKFK